MEAAFERELREVSEQAVRRQASALQIESSEAELQVRRRRVGMPRVWHRMRRVTLRAADPGGCECDGADAPNRMMRGR